jgi:hypothetical protein
MKQKLTLILLTLTLGCYGQTKVIKPDLLDTLMVQQSKMQRRGKLPLEGTLPTMSDSLLQSMPFYYYLNKPIKLKPTVLYTIKADETELVKERELINA